MKIYEGTIITCDENNTVCKYLVESEGKIIYVGDELPEEYKGKPTLKLGEKALIPSFADTHMHFASFATFHAGLNVMEVKDNIELAEKLERFVKNNKSKIVIAFGASAYSVKERKLISRAELDKATGNKPVMVVKYDGHACIINTALLQKVKDKIKDLRGFNEDTGEMNQEAFFAVSDYVTNAISPVELIKNMQKAMDYVATKGIGMVHTVSGVGFTGDLDVDMERFVGRGAESGFQLRVFFQTMDVKKVIKRKLPRVGGCFETALDGCFGSKDAALNEPYEASESTGVLYYSDERVTEFCKAANRAGLQIELHAIGDRAFEQAARAIKAALDDYPRKNHRHGIIHACLPTEEGIAICKEYNIQLLLQTSFINWKQEPDEYLEEILGAERSRKLNPVKTFLENDIVISAGSDAPCTDPNPMLWIHNACNHSVKEESISVYDALKMCTYNGYYACFDEDLRGSLQAGKIADMVILSENPYTKPTENLKDIQVLELILAGKPYEKQKKSVIKLLIDGMFTIKNKKNI